MIACGQNQPSESQTDEICEPLNQRHEEIKDTVFQLIDTDIKLPKVNGDIIDQQSWTDKNGTWHCVLTELIDVPNEFAEFRLYKFKENQQGTLLEQQVYIDSISCGAADVVAESDTKKLIISDIDNDNKGEVTFAYTLSCTYDVSPQRRILIVNIDRSMHRLVGYTLDYGPAVPDPNDLNLENYEKDENGYWPPPVTSGRYESEKEFSQLSDTFLIHAKKIWLEILNAEYDIIQKEMKN